VNNFKDEFRPRAVEVPSGKAVLFSKKMNRFIQVLQKDLPAIFESEPHLKRLSAIKNRYADKQNRLFQKVESYAAKKNIQIVKTDEEFDMVPVVDGEPLTAEDFTNLSNGQKDEIEENK